MADSKVTFNGDGNKEMNVNISVQTKEASQPQVTQQPQEKR